MVFTFILKHKKNYFVNKFSGRVKLRYKKRELLSKSSFLNGRDDAIIVAEYNEAYEYGTRV